MGLMLIQCAEDIAEFFLFLYILGNPASDFYILNCLYFHSP